MRQLVTKYQPPGVVNKAGEIFVDEVTGQIKIGDGSSGDFKIIRGVIEHDASLVNYTDGTPANAQAIIQEASSAAGSEAWEIRDVLIVSNSLCTNFQRASTASGFNRSIFAYVDEGEGDARKNALLHNGNMAWTLTSCVNAITGSSMRPLVYSGVAPTLTNCTEVVI